MNIFDLINKIQIEVGDAVSDTLTKTTDISLWELIWGFDTETGEYSWTSIIIMSMLFLLSALTVYIFIERFLAIRRALNEERDFMTKIKEYVNDGKLDAAKQLLLHLTIRWLE